MKEIMAFFACLVIFCGISKATDINFDSLSASPSTGMLTAIETKDKHDALIPHGNIIFELMTAPPPEGSSSSSSSSSSGDAPPPTKKQRTSPKTTQVSPTVRDAFFNTVFGFVIHYPRDSTNLGLVCKLWDARRKETTFPNIHFPRFKPEQTSTLLVSHFRKTIHYIGMSPTVEDLPLPFPAQLESCPKLTQLYILGSRRGITGLSNFPALSRLTLLSMRSIGLIIIPAELLGLTNLQTLNLSDNEIRGGFQNTPKGVRKLLLGHNELKDTSKDLSALRTCEELSLEGNPLEDGELKHFPPNLTSLSLRSAGLKAIPTAVKALQRLKVIDLEGNPIVGNYGNLPPSITSLDLDLSLRLANVDPQNIVRLRSEIAALKNLRQISISAPRVECLEYLAPIATLRRVTIWWQDAGSAALPKAFSKAAVTTLGLHGLSPINLSNMPSSVTALYASANGYTCFPFEPSHLHVSNLRVIDFSDNKLGEQEAEQDQKSLPTLSPGLEELPTSGFQLENVNFSRNKFKAVPALLLKMPRLRRLNLSHNPLKHNLGSLSALKQLQSLNLSSCGLDHLPTVLADLKALTSLDVSYNDIRGNWRYLPALIRDLAVIRNGFSDVPVEFFKLKHLKRLIWARSNDVLRDSIENGLQKLSKLGVTVVTSLPQDLIAVCALCNGEVECATS